MHHNPGMQTAGEPMCDILLVDDDEHIRDVLATLLREAGFLVEAASDDRAALTRLADDDPPRLLLTDVDLGDGLDGLAVASHARGRLPDLPVIYMTGRPDTLDYHRYGAAEWLLPKPFVTRRLLALVHTVLGDPQPGPA